MKQHLLRIDASSNPQPSTSRKLADQMVDQLKAQTAQLEIFSRDVSSAMPMIDSGWIAAAYTPKAQRSPQQVDVLALSEQLIDELNWADEIILATPMYNFSLPTGLKAWVDLVTRVGETFRYTETGPRGLLEDTPVTLIVSTGGVVSGSETDFLTPYIIQALGFIGISTIEVIAADGMSDAGEERFEQARSRIDQNIRNRFLSA